MIRELTTLGFKRGEGFYVAGDKRGRSVVLNVVGTYASETEARVKCLHLFYKRVDEKNRKYIAGTLSTGGAD